MEKDGLDEALERINAGEAIPPIEPCQIEPYPRKGGEAQG